MKPRRSIASADRSAASASNEIGLQLGLCCQFVGEPIKFRTTTVTSLLKLVRDARLHKLADICRHNADALTAAIDYCAAHHIDCFRINSQILPCKTHPEAGYSIEQLPGGTDIAAAFAAAGALAARVGVRLVFHPDQFVVLNSPNDGTVSRSVAELEYQTEVARWVGADVVNIHAGGGFGNKPAALDRLARTLDRLDPEVRSRLTLENDDRTYTPAELLPFCHTHGVPLVYDVHHHRCLGDGLSIEQTTEGAIATWNRRPLFHISSPLAGWAGPQPHRHHDYIDINDVPACWLDRDITVEVEAKAKELAIAKLRRELADRRGA